MQSGARPSVASFAPDTASVDVYLSAFSGGTATLWLSSVGYGDVSGYEPIAAGVYAVSMRPHGAAATTPAVLTWTVDLTAGSCLLPLLFAGEQLAAAGDLWVDAHWQPGPKTAKRLRLIWHRPA